MQLTLQLDATSRRPVVKLDWFNGCRALLDTGALFPVWTSDGKLLQQLGAKLEKKEVTFGGFGVEIFNAVKINNIENKILNRVYFIFLLLADCFSMLLLLVLIKNKFYSYF